jgi:hypothetical protein
VRKQKTPTHARVHNICGRTWHVIGVSGQLNYLEPVKARLIVVAISSPAVVACTRLQAVINMRILPESLTRRTGLRHVGFR